MSGNNLSEFTHRQVGDAHFLLHRSGTVVGVNPTAACIWSLIEEAGASPTEVAAELCEAMKIPLSEARATVEKTIEELEQARGPERVSGRILALRTAEFVTPGATCPAKYYLLSGRTLQISYETAEAEQLIHPMLSHLECEAGDGGGRMQIQRVSPGSYLVLLSDLQFGPVDETKLVHAVLSLISIELVQHVKYQLCVHAAAVEFCGTALIFPGLSGAGKSTLAAGLARRGFSYLADDTVFVESDDHAVFPFNIPSAAKENVWEFLAGEYPKLNQAPVFHSYDGRRIKHLFFPLAACELRSRYPVSAIVFPKYKAGAKAELELLSLSAAAQKLAETGYSLRKGATQEDFLDLISWLDSILTCSLTYSNLDDAAELLRALHDQRRIEANETAFETPLK